ncbi:MAG: hypothetical protein GBAus27B_000317 [Mycoplasmataceae bacterium]|nr:MAG: hypothetical protein GBAus27B_000317 [Mycoplasmataceae bacterium]
MEGYAKVSTYLSKKTNADLTDQELETLLDLSAEASVNFDYLTQLFSDEKDGRMSNVFSSENNERRQEELKELREMIIREQVERKFRQNNNDLLNKNSQMRIAELEKELNFLRSKGKTKKADRLQSRIDVLKKQDNSEQSPKSSNPGNGNFPFSIIILLIILAILILFGGFLILKKTQILFKE